MFKIIIFYSKAKNLLKKLLPSKLKNSIVKLVNFFIKSFFIRKPLKPTNYKRYLRLQIGKYLSHESLNKKWMDGQIRYLEKEFQNVDRNKFILDISCGDGVGLKNF